MPKRCSICKRKFIPSNGRHKLCSAACRAERAVQVAAAQNTRRRAAGHRPLAGRVCAACPRVFDAKTPAEKYCGQECKAKGLQAAIARQRERREKHRAPVQTTPTPEQDT